MNAPTVTVAAGFHYAGDAAMRLIHGGNPHHFAYTFENLSHPYVEALISQLNRHSVAGILDPKFLRSLEDSLYFNAEYPPHADSTTEVRSHPREIDVSPGGAYSTYNWELFYHIPVAIAVHLSKNQRFAEAQRWFHHVFDPTCTDDAPAPQRWWKFIAFRHGDTTNIEALLELLGTPDDELTPQQVNRKQWVYNSYEAILSKPFDPHAVARARPLAYQYYVVMKYLSNLIAWGDSLFLQYTIETVNEASMHYVLAANILGPHPEKVPQHASSPAKSFAQLKKAQREAMGSTLIELETQIPFNSTLPGPPHKSGKDGQNGSLYGLGESLYFCVPRNDTLLRYWDTVADRLFKIRHCMDITGVVRPLALWDPPIDPGMLIKARAAGIDIGSIVSGLNQPVGPLRSLVLIQKATELCGEVKSLGGALLSAWEKGDAEQLALLRQSHEIKLEQRAQDVRFLQWKQAQEATDALLKSRETTLERYKYYLRLLGQTPDSTTVPDSLKADRRKLTEENFDDAYSALVGEYDKTITLEAFPAINWANGNAPSNQAGASSSGQLYLTDSENADINTHQKTARDTGLAASILHATSLPVLPIPSMNVNLHFWGMGVHSKIFGGDTLSEAVRITAEGMQMVSATERGTAEIVAKTASYERRADDWRLQANLAAHELMQMGRQIIGSLIAEQVAEHEYQNAKTQLANSQEVDQKLRAKFTNAELYGWMQGEIARIYYDFYRFAVDIARRAERTMKRELMRPELDQTDFIRFNYWDTGRKGLLSGEALFLDLKRMEMAHHDNNKRELELTRNVSLRQLDPHALIMLRTTGTCTVSIPERLYDLDAPGCYMRRIKTVALSLPSVVGPYTSVNCVLTLQRSTIRVSSLASSGYARDADNPDDRFVDYLGSTDEIVTSGAVNDSGMFETNLRDERFLPFEGAGAISTWRLELPSQVRAFDYMTISDLILHIRYTARDGGAALAAKATKELVQALQDASTSRLMLLLNLRHDFPVEWAAFAGGTGDLVIPIRAILFPYLAQGRRVAIDGLVLFAAGKDGKLVQLTVDAPSELSDGVGSTPIPLTLHRDAKVMTRSANAHVFLVIQYHLGSPLHDSGAG
jgi:Tc toxin complex TcA C-terminal TcB-binding domain